MSLGPDNVSSCLAFRICILHLNTELHLDGVICSVLIYWLQRITVVYFVLASLILSALIRTVVTKPLLKPLIFRSFYFHRFYFLFYPCPLQHFLFYPVLFSPPSINVENFSPRSSLALPRVRHRPACDRRGCRTRRRHVQWLLVADPRA